MDLTKTRISTSIDTYSTEICHKVSVVSASQSRRIDQLRQGAAWLLVDRSTPALAWSFGTRCEPNRSMCCWYGPATWWSPQRPSLFAQKGPSWDGRHARSAVMGERFADTDACQMRKASIKQVPTGLCQRKFGASESLQPLKTVGGLGHCHSECKYAPFWICQKNPDSLIFWQLFASVSSTSCNPKAIKNQEPWFS